MDPRAPQRRVGTPLLGAVTEQVLDLRRDEQPPARLADLGLIDDGRHPVDQGAVALLCRGGRLGCGDGGNQEGRDRGDAGEDLGAQEVRVRRAAGEGSLAPRGVEDRDAGDDDACHDGARLTEAQRRPEEQREDDVAKRAVLASDENAGEGQRHSEPDGLPHPGAAQLRQWTRRQDEQRGRDDQVAARVTQPPDPPRGGDRVGRDLAAGPQAEHADRGAHDRAQPSRKEYERDDVAHPAERGAESHAGEQVGAGQRLERVARRDPEARCRAVSGW